MMEGIENLKKSLFILQDFRNHFVYCSNTINNLKTLQIYQQIED